MANLTRVPQWGRIYENFGEDPYLISRMTVAYIRALQENNVIACVKAFVCNNQEWNRHDVDVKVDERTLREIYFPAFKAAVKEAHVLSMMGAYNKVNGNHCCESSYLITDILKGEWGFKGFIMSDWGGVHNTLKAANAGMDMEMPSGEYFGDALLQAVRDGQLEEKIIDNKVRRILRVMFQAGLFDSRQRNDRSVIDSKEHRLLARELAQKSIVLLKNDQNILPLQKSGVKSIAVIGPNADVARMYGCGSGWLDAFNKISPLQGMRNKVAEDCLIYFERASRQKRSELPYIDPALLIPSEVDSKKQGLWAEYFNNSFLQGRPVLTRVDDVIDFNWGTGSPAPGIVNEERFSIRWTGKIVIPETGTYELGFNADNGFRLYLDNKLLIDSWSVENQSAGVLKTVLVDLMAHQHYDLRVEYFENIGTSRAKLGMARYFKDPPIDRAIDVAKNSDVVVVCAGLNDDLEGEDIDRETLALPTEQIDLIQKVSQVNKNTVVVLFNAGPLTMADWIEHVPAVIEAFYPGQEGGNALADILFGDVNPSGKLPMTFIKKWQDSPAYKTYPGATEIASYSEGLYVGYRYFDSKNIQPLFPFGYGLSYTQFKYSDLKINPTSITKDHNVTISLKVKNIGRRSGDEIVQLYVRDIKSSVDRPFKELKDFKRIPLEAGEEKRVTFTLDSRALSFFDTKTKKWIVEPGQFEVLIGCSSRDIRAKGLFELE